MTLSVLFLGATGYIGSSALNSILKAAPDVSITVVGRNPKVLKGFEEVSSQLKGVQGSLEDCVKLTELAAAHDVIVNCADADNIEATRAILRGLKQRFEKTGRVPALIHTSGTGVLSDNAEGEYAGELIYTDGAADNTQSPPWLPISSIPLSALHRDVDLEIEAADTAGYARTYIIMPSTIYGIAAHVFAQRGLANPQSQQVPHLTRWSLDRRAGAVIGRGANLWPNVHIDDTGDLFALVFQQARKADGGDHGKNGYYFAENGEHSLKQVGDAIGAALFAKGLADSPEPRTLTDAELQKYSGGSKYLGGNSRARGVHSRAIGWIPKHKSFIAEIAVDVDWTLSHDRGKGPDGNWEFGPGPVRVGDGWRMPGDVVGQPRMK